MEQKPKLTPEQRARQKQVSIKQEGGDDGYCWVLRVGGYAVFDGMTRSEAEYRRKRWIETGEH